MKDREGAIEYIPLDHLNMKCAEFEFLIILFFFQRSMENTTIVCVVGQSEVVRAKLVIKDFANVMGEFKPGKSIQSEPFLVEDTPLAIAVYPNGDEHENQGHVSLFLRNKGDQDLSVRGELITDVATIDFDCTQPVRAGYRQGRPKFLTHAQCAEAFKEKDFVVEAKLEAPGPAVQLVGGQKLKKQKLNVLENMFNNMAWPDFTLVFEGEEVPCHKEVLAAASSVFEAMVGNNHKEAIEGKANIKISADVGRAFVRYIYTEDVERDVMKEQASTFLSLGEMYNLQGLKEAAELELLSQLKKENMVDMIHLGELHKAQALFEAALRKTRVNMTWLRNQVNSASSFCGFCSNRILLYFPMCVC